MNKINKRTLVLAMVGLFLVLYVSCLLALIKGANERFEASSEAVASQIAGMIENNDNEKRELQDSLKEEYISRAKALAYILEKDSMIEEDYDELCEVAALLDIDEVNVFGGDGLIAYSTVKDYVGFSIYSGGQIAFFEPMMNDRSLELCQDLTPNTKDGKLIMYAAVWRTDGDSIVQIGISPERLLEALENKDLSMILDKMPLDKEMYFIYDREQDQIVSSTDERVLFHSDESTEVDLLVPAGRMGKFTDGGETYAYILSDYGKYRIGVCDTVDQIYGAVDENAVILFVFLAGAMVGLFILINYITTNEKKTEQKYITDLKNFSDQLSNYKRAVLSDAVISLEVNLNKDELYYGVWKDDDGNEVRLRDILGLDTPCSYETYIKLWNERFVKNVDSAAFSGKTDREYLIDTFNNGLTEITFDYEAKKLSGKNAWFRRTICMIRNQSGDIIAFTSVKDITDLLEQVKREEAYIRALALEYDSLVVVGFDDDKTKDEVLFHSRITDDLRKLLDEDVVNEKNYSRKLELLTERYIHPDDREEFTKDTKRERLLESFTKHRSHTVDVRLMRSDGSYLYYQFCFVPLRDDAGQPTGVIAGMRNIDAEVRGEMESRLKLEEAMMAAEAANQAKSSFLFSMSHDIRTPMNAIIGFTDIARKHIDDRDRVIESLEKVRMSSNHLLSLINDVLDMSRVESGAVNIDEEAFCVDIGRDNMFSMLNGSAEAKNIIFTSRVDDSVVHHWIYLDRLRMMRVLTNIISNSVKYTEPGGKIDLLVEELPCEREGYAHYRYSVTDTGIGMSEEFLAHIFEPFSRAETATRSGVVGTGLGMAITKSLTELMGGTIAIESRLGEGTAVTLDFEYRIAEPVSVKSEMPEIMPVNLDGKKILLVEDNELNREIATEILEEEGIIVDTAEDGDIAVEKMAGSYPGQYDLILMDIQMPRMNGYDATRAIRKLPNLFASGIPIIAMTANAFDEDKQNAFAAGMNGHIAKPIDISKLLNTLSDVFE